MKKRIGIIGGGPSALYMYQQFIHSGMNDCSIDIFELNSRLGAGMPYSEVGATAEHVTNVSGNEIPPLTNSLEEWVKSQPAEKLKIYQVDLEKFNGYKVLPRLLFGEYLSAQFDLLLKQSKSLGIKTSVHYNTAVIDIHENIEANTVTAFTDQNNSFEFEIIVICTGHRWPSSYEGKIPGYYDSPYPPSKFQQQSFDHPVALRGSSLTAIDAIRTLSRQAGTFVTGDNGKSSFILNKEHSQFKIIMHSRNGLLPAIRFHLENSHLSKDSLLSKEDLINIKDANDGFIPLDIIFEENFMKQLYKKDKYFYDKVAGMKLEAFVDYIMGIRENIEPFNLFKAEYQQAEKSIQRQQSVHWKEALAILSFAMNYPAKYFTAEDMIRLQKHLMPLISVVIAFLPQSSAEELIALHEGGFIEIVSVGDKSKVEVKDEGGIVYHFETDNGTASSIEYKTFIDCIGQLHLEFRHFPFPTIVSAGSVSPAMLKFKQSAFAEQHIQFHQTTKDETGNHYLKVSGIAINDYFQAIDKYGAVNPRIYVMAVPYIGGFNPDYSGLDFCDEASRQIIKSILK